MITVLSGNLSLCIAFSRMINAQITYLQIILWMSSKILTLPPFFNLQKYDNNLNTFSFSMRILPRKPSFETI